MRKSPLAQSNIKASIERVKPQRINVQRLSCLKPKLTMYDGKTMQFDLSLLYRFQCTPNGKTVSSRKSSVVKIALEIERARLDGVSNDFLSSRLINFKVYIEWCDSNGLDPMSKEGYRAYVGDMGELRRLTSLARHPLPYIFMYEDGQELGITEGTAGLKASNIRAVLGWCGVYQANWHSGIGEYINARNPTKPYSDNELSLILRRLQYYFYSLSAQLIAHRKNNPNSPPPRSLSAVVDKLETDKVIEIVVGNAKDGSYSEKSVKCASPFNRAMQAAYYLFSYYTSFNTSSILDVRLPIDILNESKEGRTIKHATVRGFKGRSNKIVSGLFSDFNIDNIPKAEDTSDNSGYIIAEVDKKDGLRFIKALAELSSLYSSKCHQHLFYHIDRGGRPRPIGRTLSSSSLAFELGLYSDTKKSLTDHLIDTYFLAKNYNTKLSVKIPNGPRRIVSKQLTKSNKSLKPYILSIAYAATRCLTDITLKGMCMPLSFSETSTDGFITVYFNYENGNQGEFTIEPKHRKFFESLQEYASSYNPITPSKYHPNKKVKTPYLFPVGSKYKTRQWDGIELTPPKYLNQIGITSGDYFLELNAQKFRAKTSNDYYNPSDAGYSLSKHILHNTIDTLHKHYADGHPDQSIVMASQAIQVIEEWSSLGDITAAKNSVKEQLSIEVLEYDEWKKLRLPTNLNGVICSAEPDAAINPSHRESQVLANKLLGSSQSKVSCYQFDMCAYCKSAKLVDDVHSIYKFLSFTQWLEDAAIDVTDRMPHRSSKLFEKAKYFRELAENNISIEVLNQAEEKLLNEGRYFLHDEEGLTNIRDIENA